MRKETDDMQVARDTLYSLIIGIILTGIVFCILGALISKGNVPFVCGIILGLVTACGIAVHLYKTIDKCLDMDADSGCSYTRRMALLRSLLMGVPVIIAVLLSDYLSPIGVFIGLLSLKVGALLQPVLIKLIQIKR